MNKSEFPSSFEFWDLQPMTLNSESRKVESISINYWKKSSYIINFSKVLSERIRKKNFNYLSITSDLFTRQLRLVISKDEIVLGHKALKMSYSNEHYTISNKMTVEKLSQWFGFDDGVYELPFSVISENDEYMYVAIEKPQLVTKAKRKRV